MGVYKVQQVRVYKVSLFLVSLFFKKPVYAYLWKSVAIRPRFFKKITEYAYFFLFLRLLF